MIVNHQYKFIFLKTRKTAGTSIEIALSQFCGPDDIITLIAQEDENKRQNLGLRGPKNYKVPLRYYGVSDWFKLFRGKGPKHFFNHAPARYIRRIIGEKVWNSYFKFCFERNPFDKAISRYYWSTRNMEHPPTITDYLKSAPIHLLSNWSIYTINDEIVVDFVGRYDNLTEDLAKVSQKIGLPSKISLPNTKDNSRKIRSHYSKVLNVQDRIRIGHICAKELAFFSYSWDEK